MAMDYRKCAQDIFEQLGGRENLVSAAHCATRLRLVTVDNSRIDMKALEDVDGVKGVFSASGQIQIILGTGTESKVYDEFLAITGLTAANMAQGAATLAVALKTKNGTTNSDDYEDLTIRPGPCKAMEQVIQVK